jgi:hypothetical protein
MFCGFVGDSIEFDSPRIFASFAKSDQLYNDRAMWAQIYGLKPSDHYQVPKGVLEYTNPFLTFLYIMHMTSWKLPKKPGE